MDSDNFLTEDELKASNEHIQENLVALTSQTISTFCFPHFKAHKYVVELLTLASQKSKIGFNSGSTAELYIRPLVQCIGDKDLMFFKSHSVVVQRSKDATFPKMKHQLEDTVNCLQMIPDQRFPCFVRLELTGQFRYSWDLKSYVFHKENPMAPRQYRHLPYNPKDHPGIDLKIVGPALTHEGMEDNFETYSTIKKAGLEETVLDAMKPTDLVECYHCPSWPDSASEWIVRKRPHGCPDSATVNEIASSGCDIVNVSHPDCREDPYLMRLSFSRAEVALINKWSHTQQVVFHMLRYFAKKELMPNDWERENKILCTYHMKTLMLWSCESEAKGFWENHVIEICCSLLISLSSWLQRKVCQNYFVPDCNLFSHIRNENNLQEVINMLRKFKSSRTLAEWFRKNYFDQSSYLKSFEMYESLKLSISNRAALQKCFKHNRGEAESIRELISNLRQRMEAHELTVFICFLSPFLEKKLNQPLPEPISCFCQNNAHSMESPSSDYLTAIQVLVLAKHLTVKSIFSVDYRMYDYVATLYKQFDVHDFPITYPEHLPLSKLYFIKVEELMSGLSGGQTTNNEDKLLTELSIQCLKKSRSLSDSIKDDNYPVSTMYLAALYFKVGKYQKMHELCSNLLTEGASTKQKAKVQLLLFVKDVSNIWGFVKLWTHLTKSKIDTNNWETFSLSPEIFAQYLLVLCERKQNFQHPISFDTISDKILMFTIECRMKRQPRVETVQDPSMIINTCGEMNVNGKMSQEDLIALLMETFFDRLRITFWMIRNDLRCFECMSDILLIAMYRYRRQQYDETIRLSNVLDMAYPMELLFHQQPCLRCMTTRPYSLSSHVDLFFDSDIQSIIGLRLLHLSVLKLNPHLLYANKDTDCVSKNYQQQDQDLESETWQKAKSFIETAFLAKYLRLRCLLDTNRPIDEIQNAYQSLSDLPYKFTQVERIIFGFMRKKIQMHAKRSNAVIDLRLNLDSGNFIYNPSRETGTDFGNLYRFECKLFIKQRTMKYNALFLSSGN